MITNLGKLHIKRYLAGMVPLIGGSIAFGLGETAESVNHTTMTFEVDRSDVELVSYDFPNNKLVFKAPVPENFSGKIYEIGLFSKISETSLQGKLITTFDSATEEWLTGSSPATFTTTNTRIGLDSLSHTPAGSGSSTSTLSNLQVDLSANAGSDVFKFAYNLGNANTSSIKFRFLTDSSNYYDITINSGMTAGYKVVSALKSSAVATGTPNWANITQLQVTTNSSGAGASNVNFDGVRIDDSSLDDVDYVMVSREYIASPYTKQAGMVQEVEFSLDVNV